MYSNYAPNMILPNQGFPRFSFNPVFFPLPMMPTSKVATLLEAGRRLAPEVVLPTAQTVPTSSSVSGGDENAIETLDTKFRSPKQKRRKSNSSFSTEEDEEKTPPSKRRRVTPLGTSIEFGNMVGEHRLRITFESYGAKGKIPQTFGKKGMYIPDGLQGAHTMYNEHWQFETRHEPENEQGVVCITWIIKNASSGQELAVTETVSEAKKRVSLGHTISNRVFQKAMERRANELEASLAGETNECRLSNIHSLVKALRPHSFSEGLLAFGLQHKIVQEKIK
jgi:hypothetical protein